MEIEARFAIPDHDTMQRLQRIVRLGPFIPGESVSHHVRDRYLDTATRALYQSGYACRIRQKDDQRYVTIKGLGQTESAIHERFEQEMTLPQEVGTDPETWPAGEIRELVLPLLKGERLDELLIVEQVRHIRDLREGERLVAEWSVDQVEIQAGDRQQTCRILEVELRDDGTMEDVQALVAHLTDTWGLVAEPRSKFHLGLDMLDQDDVEDERDTGRLSATERTELNYLAEHAKREGVQKRARLILGWDRDGSIPNLAMEIGMSRSWAYYWLGRFRAERMSIFSADLTAKSVLEASPEITSVVPAESDLVSRAEMTVDEMSEHFQVDVAHANCVAQHALALFDATVEFHKLEAARRRLLQVMGLLHNVGLDLDPDRHHIAGRDIVLEHPLAELSQVEQRMLAAAIYLHRKVIDRKRLRKKVITSLPPGMREDTLVLASLLRVADGLDYSQGQSTVLESIEVTPAAIHISTSGPFAETDAVRAQAKADLWEHLFDVPFFFSCGDKIVGEQSARSRTPLPAHAVKPRSLDRPRELVAPGLVVQDPMYEAGRKVLRFHFWRMLKHAPGTREGKDIEELHDMRVATRRMRSAFRVFAPYFKASAIRPYIAGLRRTGRALGAVRDLDVFIQKAQNYLETLPTEHTTDLEPLLSVWRVQRERAREEMIAYLDGPKYRDFVRAFEFFLETPGTGIRKLKALPPTPVQVQHVVPRLMYTRWASVQAFGPVLEGTSVATLHALRIECKRLRYALEFFREVLGAESEKVISEVVLVQDHLGNLNDADVANAMLSDFLFTPTKKAVFERVIAPGVVAYLAVKQRELQTLIDTFPQAWAHFNRPDVRRWLADTVAIL